MKPSLNIAMMNATEKLRHTLRELNLRLVETETTIKLLCSDMPVQAMYPVAHYHRDLQDLRSTIGFIEAFLRKLKLRR